MKITSNIYIVGGPSESHPSDAAVYLFVSGNEAALIDAGTGAGHDQVMENIARALTNPEQVKYLFLTHCHYDHTGGAAALRAETGCTIVTHKLSAYYLERGDPEVTAASWYRAELSPLDIDNVVESTPCDFPLGDHSLTFYHTPGHSPGSSVLTVRSDGKLVLFGQDVHGPLNRTLLSSREDYVRSLEFMISLDADILCEGHFGVFSGREKVRQYIESYL